VLALEDVAAVYLRITRCSPQQDRLIRSTSKTIKILNPPEDSHYVTTVGNLFTPTVPSGAEGQLNQLTPGIAGTSVATPGNSFI